MQQKVQFCTTSDGVQIAFSEMGEGYPLVLVHGWVSNIELDMEPGAPGRPYYDAFAEHFMLVRYDKRGTGLSDRNVSDFSLEPRLLDLDAVINRLKLDRYALRGMSEGGPVAIAHAVRHPDRVTHLILQGTYAHLGKSDTTDALIALVKAEWGLGSATMASMFVPSASKEMQDMFVRYQREGANRADAAAMLAANVEEDVRSLLPQVQAPTLVLTARPTGPSRSNTHAVSRAPFRTLRFASTRAIMHLLMPLNKSLIRLSRSFSRHPRNRHLLQSRTLSPAYAQCSSRTSSGTRR